eukprot:jgi/Botrbrau1/6470/Bobra.0034s0044.1
MPLELPLTQDILAPRVVIGACDLAGAGRYFISLKECFSLSGLVHNLSCFHDLHKALAIPNISDKQVEVRRLGCDS